MIDLIYIGSPGVRRYYGDLKQRKNLHYNSQQQITYYLHTDIYKNDRLHMETFRTLSWPQIIYIYIYWYHNVYNIVVDKEWIGPVGLPVHNLLCYTLVTFIIKLLNHSDIVDCSGKALPEFLN